MRFRIGIILYIKNGVLLRLSDQYDIAFQFYRGLNKIISVGEIYHTASLARQPVNSTLQVILEFGQLHIAAPTFKIGSIGTVAAVHRDNIVVLQVLCPINFQVQRIIADMPAAHSSENGSAVICRFFGYTLSCCGESRRTNPLFPILET